MLFLHCSNLGPKTFLGTRLLQGCRELELVFNT